MGCRGASWWEWLGGYTSFFCIWSNNHREQARGGVKAWISGNLSRFWKPQYLNKQSDLTLIKKLEKSEKDDIFPDIS